MATFEFKLPDIGEGVTEGEIVNWLVKEGDAVDQDQDMVEVMTDKATVTIGSPKAGKIAQIRGKVGDVMPVGSVLVVLELEGASGARAQEAQKVAAPTEPVARQREVQQQELPASSGDEGPAASAVGDIKEVLPGMQRAPAAAKLENTPDGRTGDYYTDKPLAAPATRKLARELGVDLKQVRPSGPAGRVTREDVESHQSRAAGAAATPEQQARAPESRAPQAPAPLAPPAPVPSHPLEQRVPIRGLRKRIFDNMARSKHTAAHFAYADECDVTALKALRDRCRPHAERAGVKLTFLPFFVKAVVAALKKHPAINCLVDDAAQEMVLRSTYDIGIATSTDAGLIVPVLRNADRLSIVEIAKEIERISTAARDGKSRKEDLGGSSFTVTSLGKLGGLFSTPVVNYPEVAILGIHEMKRRPVVKGDQIAIADVTVLALSFDHRVIDGHVGAAFTQEIISYIQDPDRLLVEMS
jgi:pyruvate dehydrogenase E2 component (dihydrolipoamide acetyltransferase)